MKKECINCKKVFYKSYSTSRKVWETRKYCSNNCRYKSQLGKPTWNKGLHPEYLQGKNNIFSKISPWKGKKRGTLSQEHKSKLKFFEKGHTPWNKGVAHSEETKNKISKALKGKKAWNKGLGIASNKCPTCKNIKSLQSSRCKSCFRKELVEKLKITNKGKHNSPLTEFKRDRVIGKNNFNWKGGVTSENEKIRKSKDYAIWRTAVYMRDNYTCQDCGKKGGELNADHIKPFSLYPELRLAIDNGRTLCIECHRIKTKEQMKKIWSNQYLKAVINI